MTTDFNALVGRAAQFSSDSILVVQKNDRDLDTVELKYANPSFCEEVNLLHNTTDFSVISAKLGGSNLTNHADFEVITALGILKRFRVSVTKLPENETGHSACFLLTGRSNDNSIAEGRERLYSEIARKFIELPENDAVRATMRAIGIYFDVDRCFACRLNLSTNRTDTRYLWRKSGNLTQTFDDQNPNQVRMCGWVQGRLRQGEVIQVDDIDSLPEEAYELRDVMRSNHAKSAVFAPVLMARGSLWFIGMHCVEQKRRFTPEDVTTFKVVGDLLGNAFTQTETVWSLQETQRHFTDVGANVPGVIYQMRKRPNGQLMFSYISQGVRDLTGWGPASMMSDPDLLERLIIREDRGRFRETIRKAGQDFAEWSSDIRICHRDETNIKWVRASGRSHLGANGDIVWNGLMLDITDQLQAQEALRVSEERLRRILGTSPIAIGISDVKNFKLLFANKRLGQMYHIPREELIGFDTRKFYAEPRLHRKHWVFTRREKQINNEEAECMRTDGQPFWAQITTRLIEYGGREAILWWAFDITEHKQTKEKLAHLAHHDALTGLANRRLFDEHLHKAIAMAKRSERPGVLFYFDLDGFKAVNDQHGHGFGDWVLDQVGLRLREVLRETDIGARLGGDEFAVIAQGIDDIRSIEAVVEKMQHAISAPYIKDGITAEIGLSIGVVRFFGQEDNIHQVVMLADTAMYEAKQAGKGTYRLRNLPSNDRQKAFS